MSDCFVAMLIRSPLESAVVLRRLGYRLKPSGVEIDPGGVGRMEQPGIVHSTHDGWHLVAHPDAFFMTAEESAGDGNPLPASLDAALAALSLDGDAWYVVLVNGGGGFLMYRAGRLRRHWMQVEGAVVASKGVMMAEEADLSQDAEDRTYRVLAAAGIPVDALRQGPFTHYDPG